MYLNTKRVAITLNVAMLKNFSALILTRLVGIMLQISFITLL